VRARRLKMRRTKGGVVDVGLVGDIVSVQPQVLTLMKNDGFIPVVAPMGVDENGETLNINADTVAAELAAALSAEALFLLTNVAGVLDKKGALLPKLSATRAASLIKSGVISGGMRPKIQCAIKAVNNGVRSCQIINGTQEHSLLLEVFTDEGAGTFISP